MKSVRIIREDEAAVSPVIATILMVAITVVLAAVLYVMVSGLITGPGSTPRVVGLVVTPSPDGRNWTAQITSAPVGLTTSGTYLTIFNSGGGFALTATALGSLTYSGNGAVFLSDGDSAVEATEIVNINRTTYPSTYKIQISDATQILATWTL